MTTRVYDFLRSYSEKCGARFHMPGHKGRAVLGIESLDITEISGADVLYSPSGIILESERNASSLFKSGVTHYSTEGSTLGIKAMLAIALRQSGSRHPKILAGRNAHKAFIYAAALLDFEIEWLMPENPCHIAFGGVTADAVRAALSASDELPFAVYITSPDYLGNIADVKAIADAAAEFGVPLLVDNAHGAYLAFLEESLHPIALGAAMCADSAHKTLPVLTGGAYLHISEKYPEFIKGAREMLSLFASTSPSYLTLASLDICNSYLDKGFREKLADAVCETARVKKKLASLGFAPEDTEPLKIAIRASKYGYTGDELSEHLRSFNIECELCDREYLVLMTSPENPPEDYEMLINSFKKIKPRERLPESLLTLAKPHPVLSIRQAIFAKSEIVPVDMALGRVLSQPCVSCPPAVPVAICGERLAAEAIELFRYYGIESVAVVK